MKLGMAARTCNPNTSEVKVGGATVQGQPLLHSKSEARLGWNDTLSSPHLKKITGMTVYACSPSNGGEGPRKDGNLGKS